MVLILTLVVSISSTRAAAVILGVQTMVFAVTALRGPRRSPYGFLFAKLAAARLGPARELEPVPPLRFAQLVGLVFAAAGVVGFALGVPLWASSRPRWRCSRPSSTRHSVSAWAVSSTHWSPAFAGHPLPER
ncbi:hypothetical protein I551_2360 [Mycobacterium ulcerans str. Harvey]|uniref:DUF4395 domain-containing protein n=1 Tax=Mycobacterium ulcerans str. Harvey TaxID=1299332 RepID=A0ABP3AJ39_MYCUL|nr:hypothetical protein I551_2360 [Mycobacterium ulcerans str. Harvey]